MCVFCVATVGESLHYEFGNLSRGDIFSSKYSGTSLIL